MAANGVSRVRPGRTPQFLTLGLLVVICILAFNYWNVSSRSRLLQRQVQEMTATLEELAMKKVHLEKRSEALQSQIGDANKVNVDVKTEREECAAELSQSRDRLISQNEALDRLKEEWGRNASESRHLLLDMKDKYEQLRQEQERFMQLSQEEIGRKDQIILDLQNRDRQSSSTIDQYERQHIKDAATIEDLEYTITELKRTCGTQQNANAIQGGLTPEQKQQQQQQQQQQQLLLQKQQYNQQQYNNQQQQQYGQPQNFWQRQQNFIRQQQFQQQQQQRDQQQQLDQQQQRDQQQLPQEQGQQLQGGNDHLVFQPVQDQLGSQEQQQNQQDNVIKQVNKDPGPVNMEANEDQNQKQDQDQKQPQMFPDREDNEEQQDPVRTGEDQRLHGLVAEQSQTRVDDNAAEEEHDLGHHEELEDLDQGRIEEEDEGPDADDEDEESEISDVDERRLEQDRNQDVDQGQVQVQAPDHVRLQPHNQELENKYEVGDNNETEMDDEDDEGDYSDDENYDNDEQTFEDDYDDEQNNWNIVQEEKDDEMEGELHDDVRDDIEVVDELDGEEEMEEDGWDEEYAEEQGIQREDGQIGPDMQNDIKLHVDNGELDRREPRRLF